MLEYVSFMDPATVAATHHSHKHSSHSKHRKRGRGRPPLVLPPSTSGETSANKESAKVMDGIASPDKPTVVNANEQTQLENLPETEQQNVNESIDDGEGEDIGHSIDINDSTEMAINDQEDDTPENENLESSAMDVVEEKNQSTENIPVPATKDKPEQQTRPVLIRNIHPLAGVWHGSFSITTLKGKKSSTIIL